MQESNDAGVANQPEHKPLDATWSKAHRMDVLEEPPERYRERAQQIHARDGCGPGEGPVSPPRAPVTDPSHDGDIGKCHRGIRRAEEEPLADRRLVQYPSGMYAVKGAEEELPTQRVEKWSPGIMPCQGVQGQDHEYSCPHRAEFACPEQVSQVATGVPHIGSPSSQTL